MVVSPSEVTSLASGSPMRRRSTRIWRSSRSFKRSRTMGLAVRTQRVWSSSIRHWKAREALSRFSRMYRTVPSTTSTSSSMRSWGSKIRASIDPRRWETFSCKSSCRRSLDQSRAAWNRSTSHLRLIRFHRDMGNVGDLPLQDQDPSEGDPLGSGKSIVDCDSWGPPSSHLLAKTARQ
jgi:hypothetical protein